MLPRLKSKKTRREVAVPLSEEELRLLEQMERALDAEDPKLASTLRGTTLRAHARRKAFLAAGFFLVGIGVLMAGAVLRSTVVGIVGFVVMLVSAYVALTAWRSQDNPPEQHASSHHGPFSVIEGGRSRKRASRGKSQHPQHSMMERFEERWRRRRDQFGR
ncbi:MAG TPA: DUF3040 domain-containing protein [Nocardioidaceae bacterium]|nr:DUF3040 domain-containing protein [Nocardioidaceae bacterium]